MPQRRRHRLRRFAPSLAGIVAALGVAVVSVLLGWFLAAQTVSGMDGFYRSVVPPGWREPAVPPPAPTRPEPVSFTPIRWTGDTIATPPPVELPPPPAIDPYDDADLLAADRDPPAFAPDPPPPALDYDAPPENDEGGQLAPTLDGEPEIGGR